MVYDGDRVSTDSFAFRQNGAPLFYNLANTGVPLNGNGDAWNSKISYKGVVVTTRNPAFQNTLGYDAPIFELPNAGNAQLSNNQTSATVRFSSPGENYFVHVLTTSISQYNPAFAFDKTATDINGERLYRVIFYATRLITAIPVMIAVPIRISLIIFRWGSAFYPVASG